MLRSINRGGTPMTTLVRLHVEVGQALGAHVVEGRGDVQRQGEELLQRQAPRR